MEDWDPLSEPAPVEEVAGNGWGQADAELVPVPGSEAKVRRGDVNRIGLDLARKFAKESPWETFPDSKPDLTWHTPTCTLEKWAHKDVQLELSTGICYVTINRPDDHNSLTQSVVGALLDVLFLLHARQDIRVVVFSGEGNMLCAGRDRKGDNFGFHVRASSGVGQEALKAEGQEALAGGAFPDGKVHMERLLQAKFWHAWATMPQFSICLANGSAMGDGMGVVVCCDCAIAIRTAFFGFPETKVGLVNAGISPYLLAKTSPGAAKNMFVLGQVLSAEAAHEKGIVNQLVDSVADGHKVVRELCEEVTKCGPRSLQLTKELVLGVAGRQVTEQIFFYTLGMLARATDSEEAKQCSQGANPWERTPIKALH